MTTVDVLLIDKENLEKKLSHLERENSILQNELALANTTITESTLQNEYDEAMKALSDDMRECRLLNATVGNNLRAIHQKLKFEQFNIIKMKTEVSAHISDMDTKIKSAFTMIMLKYHDMILKKDDERNNAVIDKDTEISKLKKNVIEIKTSTEAERVLMQKRIETITRNIAALESTHGTERDLMEKECIALRQTVVDLELALSASTVTATTTEAFKREIEVLKQETQGCRQEVEDYKKEIGTLKVLLEKSKSEHDIIVNQLNIELDVSNSKREELQVHLQQSRIQFDKMSTTNEALQADMAAMLQREVSLRNEVGLRAGDKNDLQMRLNSIQEKVKNLEMDHAAEVMELKEQLDSNMREKDRVTMINKELSQRIDEQTSTMKNLRQQMEDAESGGQVKLDKAGKEAAIMQRRLVELETSVEALRGDRDAALSKNVALDKAYKEKQSCAVVALQQDKDALQEKLERLTLLCAQGNEMKKSLALAQQTAAEREEEVFRLKETIRRSVRVGRDGYSFVPFDDFFHRLLMILPIFFLSDIALLFFSFGVLAARECEERTEKIHEIQVLKAKLVRYAELQSGIDFAGQGNMSMVTSTMPPRSVSYTTNGTTTTSSSNNNNNNSTAHGSFDSDDASWTKQMKKSGSKGKHSLR